MILSLINWGIAMVLTWKLVAASRAFAEERRRSRIELVEVAVLRRSFRRVLVLIALTFASGTVTLGLFSYHVLHWSR